MRSMKLPLLCILAVFIIPLMMTPLRGDGWFWEIGNGLGFLGLAVLLILTLNGRNKGGHSNLHRWLGFTCLFAIVSHVLWFLLGDNTVIEYIKFGAPYYMVLGVLALALIILLTFSSLLLFRKKAYQDNITFLLWHRYLSLVILFASVLHMTLSGYYFVSIIQWIIMLLLIVFVLFFQDKSQFKAPAKNYGLLLFFTCIVLAGFVFIRSGIS